MNKTMVYNEIHFNDKNIFPFSTSSFSASGLSVLKNHNHKEFEIIYFKKGKALYEIDFLPYIIEEESILIIPKNAVHSARSVDLLACEGDVFIFSDLLLEDSLKSFYTNTYTFPLINGDMIFKVITLQNNSELFLKLKDILLRIVLQNTEKKLAYELLIKGLILEFFALIFQSEYKIIRNFNKNDLEKIEKMKVVYKYISENFKKEINLQEAAKLVSLNNTYFSRYFKEHSGQTFNDYVNTYRITHAASLLLNDMNITDICFESGFQDLSYFIKVFKKKMNETPFKYKLKFNKKDIN